MNKEDMIKQVLHELEQPNISIEKVTNLIKAFKTGTIDYKKPNIEDVVIHTAAIMFDVTVDEVKSKSRAGKLPFARKFICKYLMDLHIFSDKTIGIFLSRHRTTIIYAKDSCNDILDVEKKFKKKWDLFKYKIDEMNLRLEVE